MKAVQKYWWAVWTTSSTGDAAIRCGRLHLQPVVVELSLWQWGLPGMISVSYTHLDVYKRQAEACASRVFIEDKQDAAVEAEKTL